MDNKLPSYLKGKKASDVFMEYVEPFLIILLEDMPDMPSLKEIEKILMVPWLIWNAIVAEKIPSNEVDYLAWIDSILIHMPSTTKELVDFMKHRKINDFSQYQYLFGKYEFYYDHHNKPRVTVESSLPG